MLKKSLNNEKSFSTNLGISLTSSLNRSLQ